MSVLARLSTTPLSSERFDRAAIAWDEGQVPSFLPLRSEWHRASGLRFVIKRVVDLAGALVGLVVLSPVMLAVALWIRLDSPGPVLFRQVRRGYRGRPFQVLKFRSMAVNAEQRLCDLEQSNESAGGVLFKLRNDPRVTRLGRSLRRFSLDELPQLINVVQGEMTLVGPRPLQLRDSDRLRACESRRLRLPPPGPARSDGPLASRRAEQPGLRTDGPTRPGLHRERVSGPGRSDPWQDHSRGPLPPRRY